LWRFFWHGPRGAAAAAPAAAAVAAVTGAAAASVRAPIGLFARLISGLLSVINGRGAFLFDIFEKRALLDT